MNRTTSARATPGKPWIIMFIALLLGILATYTPSLAATLLPLAETSFFDANGNPLSGGSVFFYIPSTTTPKDTWKDAAGTMLNTNPVVLDAAGRAIIYGTGAYRQLVKDSIGNTIWDQVTTDTAATTGISWGGTSSGSANAQTVSASGFTPSAGSKLLFIAGFTNTSALTVNPNGSGPITVLKPTTIGAAALVGGEVAAGNLVELDYDGTQFQIVNPFETPITGTATDIPSAATTSIGAIASHFANVTGVTTITSLGSASVNAPIYVVKFASSLTLTYNATSLIIPGAQNIQTSTGDSMVVEYLGASNWRVQEYNFASPPIASPPLGRLTLTTGVPVMTSDTATTASIFYTPYIGNTIPIWNGIAFTQTTFSELTLTLSNPNHAANTNYDIYIAFNAAVLSVCTGPAWASDTTRGAGAGTAEQERKFGLLVNKNSMTCRNGASTFNVGVDAGTYVGTFRTSAAAGDTLWTCNPAAAAGGGNGKLFLWNMYNRIPVACASKDSTDTWTYTTATWRSADNSTTNRITGVFGQNEEAIDSRYNAFADNNNSSSYVAVGVGLDITNGFTGTPADVTRPAGATAAIGASSTAMYYGQPGLGVHFFQATEISGAGGGPFWGDNGAPTNTQSTLMFFGRM